MVDIFLQTLPFFALIALGYFAGRTGFFSQEATAHLTKFVFYFALSAMIFRFAANLNLRDVVDWNLGAAYFTGTSAVYLLATLVAALRKTLPGVSAIEAQCAVIGNVGFLGIPMLVLLMGPAAIAPIMTVLAVDLIFFGGLVVILITASRDGRMSHAILRTILMGLLKNPMIVSICLGLAVSGLSLAIPGPADAFLELLGNAATPGALFAIGASLASKSAEKLQIAVWLSFCKLGLHPAAVAVAALFFFSVEPFDAGVIIAAAALPVAGNVYMIAQHYGVAPQRVSAAILLSTILSIISVSLIIGAVNQ